MDGVLADFEGAIRRLAPDKEFTPNDNNDWVFDLCKQNPNIFLHLEPIPGSIEAVKKLMQHYDVYFLSVPMDCVPQSYTDKRLWIDRHFGDLGMYRLILTHQKDFNIGDYLIDDRLKHGVDKFVGKHIHFGKHPYFSWAAILRFLIVEHLLYIDEKRLHNS